MKILLATRNAGKLREVREILSRVDGATAEPESVRFEVIALDGHPAFDGEDDVEETGATFLDNALIKAEWAAHRLKAVAGSMVDSTAADPTAEPSAKIAEIAVVADDSGLEVDALGGAPGVKSARYAGESARDLDNNTKMLAELAKRPDEPRTARFRCAVVLYVPMKAAVGPFARLAERAESAALDEVEEGTPVRLGDAIAMAFNGVVEGVIIDEPRGSGGFGYDPHFLLPELGRTTAQLPAQEKNALSHRGEAFRKLSKALEKEEV